ncbi:helix-turn-helix domain-containing protein [Yoonia sp.]|uniref:helix-turn-helix domain-containing protein n=1 Tax=Yoonia sp. TaxID=2212373 RepID=UPI0040489631
MSSSKPLRLLTISEAAEYLAISERSIKRLIARGDLPCIRVGSALRFVFADLEAFIARNRTGGMM